jgi:hypothetical protein
MANFDERFWSPNLDLDAGIGIARNLSMCGEALYACSRGRGFRQHDRTTRERP